jgi:hypothetical protein
MWQISLMLGFIPSWFWTLLLIVGIVGVLAAWVLKFIPFVKNYRLPIQVISVASLLVSVWFLGNAANEEKWKAQIKEMEEKIAAAEAQAAATTRAVEVKVVKEKEFIKGKTEYITRYIDKEIIKKEEVIKFVENCPLPKDIIDAHNAAATMNQAAQGEKK